MDAPDSTRRIQELRKLVVTETVPIRKQQYIAELTQLTGGA
jgi:hypothetical protein